MKIYKAEAADNLAEIIKQNTSIAYCVGIKPTESVPNSVLNKIQQYAVANLDEEIFYRTKSVLASTTWNKNDDVFGSLQTWAARHTPVHTYTDIDHEHQKIVGCITDTWVVDAEGNLIDDDTEEKDLPEKFHLCNSAVIWKHFKDEDLVARAATLIEEIESGKKFVSMECLFSDFDYSIISPENKQYVVARNEETAFLTKHLRVYGGEGSYNGYKIGRFLKNMVFSGKGYVDKPANPESIIFDEENEINFASSSYQNKWLERETVMASENSEVETLKSQVAELTRKLADANVKAFEDDLKELREELAQANESNSALADEKKELAEKAAQAEKSVKDLEAKISELTSANTDLEDKIKQAEAEKITANRVSVLVEGGYSNEDAVAKVEKFKALSDEQFDEIASDLVEAKKMYDDKKKKEKEDAEAGANPEKILNETVANKDDVVVVEAEEVDETAEVRTSIASYIAHLTK